MSEHLKASVALINAYHNKDIEEFHNIEGANVIIDAFIPADNGEGWWPVIRMSGEEQISKVVHISTILEFKKFYETECAYSEYFCEMEDNELVFQEIQDEIMGKGRCPRCLSTKLKISGDDVHFGYTGFPICPDCKEC